MCSKNEILNTRKIRINVKNENSSSRSRREEKTFLRRIRNKQGKDYCYCVMATSDKYFRPKCSPSPKWRTFKNNTPHTIRSANLEVQQMMNHVAAKRLTSTAHTKGRHMYIVIRIIMFYATGLGIALKYELAKGNM